MSSPVRPGPVLIAMLLLASGAPRTHAQALWNVDLGKQETECVGKTDDSRVFEACVHAALGVLDALAEQEGGTATVRLGGREATLRLDRVARRGPGDYSLFGALDQEPLQRFQLTRVGDQVVAWMMLDGSTWLLRPHSAGGQALFMVDPDQLPENLEDEATLDPSFMPPTRDVAEVAEPVIDVLVLYTEAVTASLGEGAVAAQFQAWEDWTNQALGSGGLPASINVIPVEVSYTPAGDLGTDLSRLQSSSDGFLPEAHTLRVSMEADLVHLVVAEDDGSSCGVAYRGTGLLWPAIGFGVTAENCGAATFAHEVGHNFGFAHDSYVSSSSSWPWGYGYVDPGYAFRTIMAYDDQCDDASATCPRVQFYSDPGISYDGSPLGSVATAAERSADNIRVLEETGSIVSLYDDYLDPLCDWVAFSPDFDSSVDYSATTTVELSIQNSGASTCSLERFSWRTEDQASGEYPRTVVGFDDVTLGPGSQTTLTATYSPASMNMIPGEYTVRLYIDRESSYWQLGTQTVTGTVTPDPVVVTGSLDAQTVVTGSTVTQDLSGVFSGGTTDATGDYQYAAASNSDAIAEIQSVSGTTLTVVGGNPYDQSVSPAVDASPATITVTAADDNGQQAQTTYTITVTPIAGDVSGEGEVDVFDAVLVLGYSVGIDAPAEGTKQFEAADWNGNGVLQSFDAFEIFNSLSRSSAVSKAQTRLGGARR